MDLKFQRTAHSSPSTRKAAGSSTSNGSSRNRKALSEVEFAAAISLERKRSERSAKQFLLALANLQGVSGNGTRHASFQRIIAALASSLRETDILGWHQQDGALGVIFTELGDASREAILSSVRQRLSSSLHASLKAEDASSVLLSFHFFPTDSKSDGLGLDANLYPDFTRSSTSRRAGHAVKRTMDLSIAVLALVLLSPLFLAISLLIRLTSKGPVLFRQIRVGQQGAPFNFLKFRSMYANNDAAIHKEYVSSFIAGKAPISGGSRNGVFKITDDPRVTPLGRLLRRTSMDELPQLLNVVMGDMSLIGPRPPLPYEFECYDVWHRRRVLEIKPGITGLWQINGRSRTSFDDMVRLDLQYAREWSLWLDLKILLHTPKAVFSGDGAY